MDTTLLGKTVRLTSPGPGEDSSRYVIVEDNGDRLLARFKCELPISPVEVVRRSDVIVDESHRA